jgi:hypothetical protein
MKTITLQGMLHKFDNLKKATETFKEEELPYEVETRVYVMPILLDYDLVDLVDCSDEELMLLAEEEGRVYSLEGFQEAFKENEVTPHVDYIRFIAVPVYE